jgi:hypothetical protein
MIASLISEVLTKYWKQIAIASFIAIIFLFGYYEGYSHEKEAYDTYKAEIEAKSAEQERHNAEVLKKQQEVTDNLAKGYADAIKKLNDYYRLHNTIGLQSRNPSETLSKVSESTITVDGKTESDQSDSTGISTIDCASDVLQLLYLQKWIKDQLLVQ